MCNDFLACFAVLEHQINPLFTPFFRLLYVYTLGETINFLQGGFSGWKRPLGTPGKKRSEQRGEKLYLKNLSGPSASLDIFPSRVEISTSPSQEKPLFRKIGIKRQIQIDSNANCRTAIGAVCYDGDLSTSLLRGNFHCGRHRTSSR
ncbi:Uncharacterized protein DBV15_05763 [Temnothorax longispinosus]|uniref:Uncharacterized protein n=1 Tax=Temnothorax longispinosus TaxID=300112 RepID=A0A4S2KK14_9HYME|nr:Uncharacterized protein DBV15_05763 [Temnothorax longispinosus]